MYGQLKFNYLFGKSIAGCAHDRSRDSLPRHIHEARFRFGMERDDGGEETVAETKGSAGGVRWRWGRRCLAERWFSAGSGGGGSTVEVRV
jgi:hypothetical protein